MRRWSPLIRFCLLLATVVPLAVSAESAPDVGDKYVAMKRARSSVAAPREAVGGAGLTREAKGAAAKRAAAATAARGRSLVSSCSSHGQCSSTEYCDTGNECWDCVWCSWANDAVDGTCPAQCASSSSNSNTCTAHSECDATSEYCDVNGACYDCTWCVALNDAIDSACPSHCGSTTINSCSSHSQCTSTSTENYYCDTNTQCWSCAWCFLANDSIDGACPPQCGSSQMTNLFGTQSCATTGHADCSAGEYCDSTRTCWACNFCDFLHDSYDGTCPSQCAISNAQLGVCWDHSQCPGLYQYCDAYLRCDSCAACRALNDAYNGECPSYCPSSGPRVAIGAAVLMLLGVSALF